MKIKTKFSLSVITVFTVLYSIGMVWLYTNIKKYFIEGEMTHYETTVQLKTKTINAYLARLEGSVFEYASQNQVYQVQKFLQNDASHTENIGKKWLISIGDQNIRSIGYLDANGKIIYRQQGNIYSDRNSAFIDTLYGSGTFSRMQKVDANTVYFSDTLNASDFPYPTILVAKKISSNPNIAFFYMEIELTVIEELMVERAWLGKSGETYLVGSDFTNRSPSRFLDDPSIDIHTQWAQMCFETPNTNPSRAGIYPDYRGVPVLGIYAYLPYLNWCLLGEVDESEALESSNNVLFTFLIGSFIFLLCIYFTIDIIAHYVVQPILLLQEAIMSIKKGKRDIDIHIRSGDEVEILGKYIQEMNHELRLTDIKIKKKVTEQTKKINLQKSELEAINKELEKFKKAVDNATDYIMILDHDYRLLYVNRSYEKRSGFASSEILGKIGHRVWSPESSWQDTEAMYKKIQDTHEATVFESQNHTKNDEDFTMKMYISPVLDASGAIVFYLIIGHDITADKRVQMMKDEFISITGHELRTPMTIVQGYTQLLLTGKLWAVSPDQSKYLQKIDTSVSYLLKMINEMLDIKKLEEGKMLLTLETFDLKVLMDEILSGFQDLYPNTQFDSIGTSVEISSDRTKLREVIVNLLGNACKYTPNNPHITISWKSLPTEDGVMIAVKDNGIGIKQNDQNKLFKKFSQIENHLERKADGTGLGLVISKLIVEKLGWEIYVKSTFGEGSTFSFFVKNGGIVGK